MFLRLEADDCEEFYTNFLSAYNLFTQLYLDEVYKNMYKGVDELEEEFITLQLLMANFRYNTPTPSQIIELKNDEAEGTDESEEDLSDDSKSEMKKRRNRHTPFRSFRPLIEKNRRGTYYKVWRRWNNVVFNIERKLLKQTKKAMSENIARNILVPITCFAETFEVFRRNVRRATRAFTRSVEQLRCDYPEIRKYIYRIEHNILILNQLIDEIQN